MTHVEKKGSNSMSHIFQRGSYSVSHIFKVFNSVSSVQKRSNNLNHNFENEGLISSIQKQKEFNSTSHKKVLLLESDNLLGSNSLSPFVKRVQFCESNFGNPVHFLWVMLKKVQICEFFFFFEKKKTNIDKKFNSWSHIQKKSGSILWVIFKKHSILCVIFFKSSISTLSHVICSILWVILKRKVQFCESCSKQGQSLSDIVEKGLKIKKKSNPFSYIGKKGSILWVM